MSSRPWDAPADPDRLAAELRAMERGRQYDAKTGGRRARFGYVLDCGCRIAVEGRELPATTLTLFCRNHRAHRRILEAKGRLPDPLPRGPVAPPSWTATT